MMWDWQVWRCFGDMRETFASKGWHPLEGVPLAAEAGGISVAFLGMDAGANEPLFELRARDDPPTVVLRGLDAIPTPCDAAGLLARRAVELRESTPSPDRLLYRPEVLAARAG